jgi:hypothetical protein
MFDVGCSMFDVGCSMLDVGCSMFDYSAETLSSREATADISQPRSGWKSWH